MAKLTRRATRQALEYLRDFYALRSWDDLSTPWPTRSRHLFPYRMWPPGQSMIPDTSEAFGRVYGRLGVESRHSAIAVVLERTG